MTGAIQNPGSDGLDSGRRPGCGAPPADGVEAAAKADAPASRKAPPRRAPVP